MSNQLSINLRDPAVAKMLGVADGNIARPGPRKELVQLAGDAPDPHGTGRRGIASTTRLDAGKVEVLVPYRGDLLMTVDVYVLPNEPIQVHYVCPRCHKLGRITGDRKQIEFDPKAGRAIELDGAKIYNGGELNIEPFQCTNELPEHAHHVRGDRHGLTLCKLTLAIDRSVAKDA